jgi:hypothetical protein
MTLDISGDYVIFDNGEAVTLRQIRPEGASSVRVANAVAGVVNRARLAAAGIEITGDEKGFSLNALQVGSLGVEVDDIIIDSAGERWRVLSTSLATLDTRWSVVCRRQV